MPTVIQYVRSRAKIKTQANLIQNPEPSLYLGPKELNENQAGQMEARMGLACLRLRAVTGCITEVEPCREGQGSRLCKLLPDCQVQFSCCILSRSKDQVRS